MPQLEGQAREDRVKEIFKETGAVLTDDHFVYTSWRHGKSYINKDRVYPRGLLTQELCQMMADDFQHEWVEVVAGPEKGGIILATHTAVALSELTGRDVLGVYAEKVEIDGVEGFEFRRGYGDLIKAKRILIVEDLLTTGGSVDKMVTLCRSLKGDVVGAAALANRGGVTEEQIGNVLLRVLLNINMQSWSEEECPLCESEVPVNTTVGKGAEFLKRKATRG